MVAPPLYSSFSCFARRDIQVLRRRGRKRVRLNPGDSMPLSYHGRSAVVKRRATPTIPSGIRAVGWRARGVIPKEIRRHSLALTRNGGGSPPF